MVKMLIRYDHISIILAKEYLYHLKREIHNTERRESNEREDKCKDS